MARTTRRRRRKHRGTQGGGIDRRGRTSRPRSRQEARARARKQMGQRREGPPTWTSALRLSGFASLVFFGALITFLHQAVGPALVIAIAMCGLYMPMAYFLNRFQYNRRQAAAQRERERRARGG